MTLSKNYNENDIAIVGMAGRFPGARDCRELWQSLLGAKEGIRHFTETELREFGVPEKILSHPNFVPAGAPLDDIRHFDHPFFSMSLAEASLTDPQHRLLMEEAWHALEDACCDPLNFPGAIGVFASCSSNTYRWHNLQEDPICLDPARSYQLLIGNEPDFLATRISYKLNLRGPSMTIKTACSSSLAAVHQACLSLLEGESDLALAGGVSLSVYNHYGYIYQEGGIFSADGRCRPFDAAANGTVPGQGVAVVALMRLTDAFKERRPIYAVIKATALNNDGHRKAGYTAPSAHGQQRVIQDALTLARLSAESVGYVETHGTGTILGDPIEIAALRQVLGARNRALPLVLGSIKSNIGHLDVAAGVTGLIKTAFAVKYGIVPPTLHFSSPNPNLNLDASDFILANHTLEWDNRYSARYGGVSSFGIGGTNVHALIQSPPESPPRSRGIAPRYMLPLSAKTPSALRAQVTNLADWLENENDLELSEVASTLQHGRTPMGVRMAVACGDKREGIQRLRAWTGDKSTQRSAIVQTCFVFPGQGGKLVGTAIEIYKHLPEIREIIDECLGLLDSTIVSQVRLILLEDGQESIQYAKQTGYAQPAMFIISYALGRYLQTWGVRPDLMLGHSLGEYVACCLAGGIGLASALELVSIRGHLMNLTEPGTMLSVRQTPEQFKHLLEKDLDIAAINGPNSIVISGSVAAIQQLERRLDRLQLRHIRLVTERAFHSQLMEPILSEFEAKVRNIDFHPILSTVISTLDGTILSDQRLGNPRYWSDHLRRPVQFAQAIKSILDQQRPTLFIEVGPGRTLTQLIRQNLMVCSSGREAHRMLPLLDFDESSGQLNSLYHALSKAWLYVDLKWPESTAITRLPAYPFDRHYCWRERVNASDSEFSHTDDLAKYLRTSDRLISGHPATQDMPIEPSALMQIIMDAWRQTLGDTGIHENSDFFELGGDSLMAVQLSGVLQNVLNKQVAADVLLTHPTPALMAKHLSDQTPAQTERLLVPLASNGDETPLFLIHPAGGSVFCFHELAHRLGGTRPIYGLQFPQTVEGGVLSIEDLASLYLKAIRERQANGPYLLAGYSFGGNVAFEMATKLQQQGETVERLIMFDSHPALAYGEHPDESRFSASFPLIVAHSLGLDPEETAKLGSLGENRDDFISRLRRSGLLPVQLSEQDIGRFFDVWKNNHHALRQHNPTRSFEGSIVFLKASEPQPANLLEALNVALPPGIERAEWGRLSTEPMSLHEIPGNHYNLLQGSRVKHVAEEILKAFAAVRVEA